MQTRRLLSVLAVSMLWALGCAQERPPLNRVQPNYFDKSFFIGKDYKSTSDDPEFYSLATVTDVGYGASQDGLFTSTYAQPLTRVKWQVTENLLIARLAYERIQGSDGKGTGKATNDGIVVAAYPISRHFDVQRSYNPSTGEQTNVIEENSVDRPWYDRQYIRVDWSKNLSTDNYEFDTLSMMGVYGGISYEPLDYYVSDPNSDDAPHFDADKGYLDVTNKAFARPGMADLSMWGMGAFPACYLDADIGGGTAPSGQCNPIELTIRQSFKKVEDKDYQPIDWDGHKFEALGAFTVDRLGYARNYGMTDTQKHYFIERYNIWARSHYYKDPAAMTGAVACYTPATTPAGKDPNRDDNTNGTADECESVGAGSQCDAFSQKCTLPFAQRTAVTLPWYFTSGSNPEYFEPTRMAAHEWDVALRSAVMSARYAECKATAGQDCDNRFPMYKGQQDENDDVIWLSREVDDCRAKRAYAGKDCTALAEELGLNRGFSLGVVEIAKMPEMVVVCHSPVEKADPAACATDAERLPEGMTALQCYNAAKAGDAETMKTCNAALTARNGDLRFHRINTITTPQTPSPWGIMVDSHDPLTGETVSASVNVWSHVTDLASQGMVDLSRYIKGELSSDAITEGTYIRDWAAAARASSSNGAAPKLLSGEREQMIADLMKTTPAALKNGHQLMQTKAMKAQQAQLMSAARDLRFDAQAPSTNRAVYENRRKKAIGSATEAALVTKMMQSYAGNVSSLGSEALMEFASPLRRANPTVLREFRQRKELALAERGACMMNEHDAPMSSAAVADLLEEKFGKFDATSSTADQLARGEKMRKYIAARYHYAVIAHEMGHSIGLRHNFVSSADAFNYRGQYWQLRTENGTVNKPCADVDGNPALVPDGSCVGPRYYDPLNANEKKNVLPMFMHSTVMDYPGDTVQDFVGLGAYDFAAARFFYGNVVSVFADDSYKATEARGQGALDKLDSFGGILGFQPAIGTGVDSQTGEATTQKIHYSQLNNSYDLIWDCRAIDATKFKPAAWNTATMGEWSPLFDGMIVSVGGQTSRCRQQKVDYVQWEQLRAPQKDEAANSTVVNAVDAQKRVRVPYGFATDRWADLGNLSVYRHDNGADAYELFDFLMTQQEVNVIFDNYRRNRQTFSVRGAANRSLERYNEKLRDAAKGLGLMANVYRDFANSAGYDFETLWPFIANEQFPDNILASGLGFDHFAKQLQRPQAGPHETKTVNGTTLLTSMMDTTANADPANTVLNIPNGATGTFGNVSYGGRLLENELAKDKGEYNSEFTIDCGSYYDKAHTAMLFTESVDNFISASRRDYLDARYRSVSIADLFPDGYRRWLANNLTGDEFIKAPRVAASAAGKPLVDGELYPTRSIGWTQWWAAQPQACFQDATITCVSGSAVPANTIAVEPQVGWEQQKFLIAMTLMYLPENAHQTWLNQLGIWELGADTDPGFANRIELHLPSGKVYIAKTFGKESIYGKTVQKAPAARILEWANQLLFAAYETTNGPDLDGDTKPDWYEVKLTNGQPRVKWDSTMQFIAANGQLAPSIPGCSATDNASCPCTANKACIELNHYEEVPFFLRQAMRDYGLADPSMKGIY